MKNSFCKLLPFLFRDYLTCKNDPIIVPETVLCQVIVVYAEHSECT